MSASTTNPSRWTDHSSRELAEESRRLIEIPDADDEDSASMEFYKRGGEEEFRIGEEYCRSEDPLDRCTGAFLLKDLGTYAPVFVSESVDVLIPMLADPDERVLEGTIWALGWRGDPRAVSYLIPFEEHPNEEIRYNLTYALSKMTEEPGAVASLLKLMRDPDRDVRDWAAFGLGNLCQEDTPEIRQALREALADSDSEVFGEALRGLALRKDPLAPETILKHWAAYHPDETDLLEWWKNFDPLDFVLRSIAAMPDPRLLPILELLATAVADAPGEEDRRKEIAKALQAYQE